MKTPIKSQVQGFLKHLGVYERLKISPFYDIYCWLANREQTTSTLQDIVFYNNTIGKADGALIFDIGANLGHKTQLFLKLGARVVSVEPDTQNQRILRQSFHDFRLSKKPVVIVGKAVSDRTGTETMWIDEPGSALNTLSPKWVDALRHDNGRFGRDRDFHQHRVVETTTIEELCKEYGIPYYIKIDVEGHEARVLSGMKSAVPFVSFEINLPEFLPEGLQCVDYLDALSPAGDFNYAPNCGHGLMFERWLPARDFRQTLVECKDPSVEIFWRSAPPRSASTSSSTYRRSE